MLLFKSGPLLRIFILSLFPMYASNSLANTDQNSSHDAFNRHLIGLFLGGTSFDEDEGREEEFTYGVEYEWRFHKHLSLGFAYETSPDAHHEDGVDVQVIELFYRPDSHWRLGLGYGEEKVGGEHSEDESLVRAGVAYDFHLGRIGLAPTLNLDFVDGNTAYVAGVVLSVSF